MKKVLMIIAPNNFRDEELFEPKSIFEEKGFKVFIASDKKKGEVAKGMLGGTVKVDLNIDEININDFDAIIFVGGSGAAVYFENKTVIDIAKSAYEKGKIIGAICIAPSILANAGILNGKRATSWPSEKENLNEKGAIYMGEGVAIEGKIVTASGPKFAKKFGEELTKLINF